MSDRSEDPKENPSKLSRQVEGGVSTGGWFIVIETGLSFLRDILPDAFPESGVIFIGALAALLLGGATTGVVHNIRKKKN